VGFSRANLFGKNFDSYSLEANSPFVVAMIESKESIDNLEPILRIDGLDSIFVGPYDLSASLGCLGEFHKKTFQTAMTKICDIAFKCNVPMGMHVVKPDPKMLNAKIKEGYQFIAYSIDSVVLSKFIANPRKE
jgi:2-dehydro-3-deoxyglucarate aldolase